MKIQLEPRIGDADPIIDLEVTFDLFPGDSVTSETVTSSHYFVEVRAAGDCTMDEARAWADSTAGQAEIQAEIVAEMERNERDGDTMAGIERRLSWI